MARKKADPYAILDVPRNASKDTIKRAYRRKAKETHPDANGGEDEAFKQVHEAYRLLTDETRRHQYDASGNWDGGGPSNRDAQTYGMLAGLLDAAIKENEFSMRDPHRCDLLATMRTLVKRKIGEIEKQKAAPAKQIKVFKQIGWRFDAKDGGLCALREIAEARVREAEAHIAHLEGEIAKQEALLAMLDGFTFRVEPQAETNGSPRWLMVST